MVSTLFLDLLNYSICSAINQAVGPEKAVEIFRAMGRTHYAELKKGNLIKPHENPMDVLESIARYLESSGYMERIHIQRLSENEAVVDMYGVAVLESSVRLTEENKQPSHIMTNTMFAALEELGYEAELIDLLFEKEKNHVREKWIIRKRKA